MVDSAIPDDPCQDKLPQTSEQTSLLRVALDFNSESKFPIYVLLNTILIRIAAAEFNFELSRSNDPAFENTRLFVDKAAAAIYHVKEYYFKNMIQTSAQVLHVKARSIPLLRKKEAADLGTKLHSVCQLMIINRQYLFAHSSEAHKKLFS